MKKYFLGICLFALFGASAYAQGAVGTITFRADTKGSEVTVSVPNGSNSSTAFVGSGTTSGGFGAGAAVVYCEQDKPLDSNLNYRYDVDATTPLFTIYIRVEGDTQSVLCKGVWSGITAGRFSGYGKFTQ